MLGLSPTLVRALIPKGEPRTDLSSLRALCTTGEPWNPDPYRWLFEHVGRSRTPIVNISGGTEVGACFLTTVITEPIKPVALGFPALGQDMDVVDQKGAPVRGQVGELVCRRPWPGMTRGIWRDSERYLDTYWRRFPGMWTHGDWASIDGDGYWYLHGRSDDTLNIAGKRIGPAELESAAIGSGVVAEAAAVGVPHAVKGDLMEVKRTIALQVEPLAPRVGQRRQRFRAEDGGKDVVAQRGRGVFTQSGGVDGRPAGRPAEQHRPVGVGGAPLLDLVEGKLGRHQLGEARRRDKLVGRLLEEHAPTVGLDQNGVGSRGLETAVRGFGIGGFRVGRRDRRHGCTGDRAGTGPSAQSPPRQAGHHWVKDHGIRGNSVAAARP